MKRLLVSASSTVGRTLEFARSDWRENRVYATLPVVFAVLTSHIAEKKGRHHVPRTHPRYHSHNLLARWIQWPLRRLWVRVWSGGVGLIGIILIILVVLVLMGRI